MKEPVDMSPEAVLKRVRIASALGIMCLQLGKATPVPSPTFQPTPHRAQKTPR